MSFLVKPGDFHTIRKVGTFTVPTDISDEQVRSVAERTWVEKWVTMNAAHGHQCVSGVVIARDPYPEVGDIAMGITDTMRWRYSMTASFSGKAEQKSFTMPDSLVPHFASNPRFNIEV